MADIRLPEPGCALALASGAALVVLLARLRNELPRNPAGGEQDNVLLGHRAFPKSERLIEMARASC